MDRAHSAAAQGCAVSRTPAARSAPALRAGATPRVCSLWLLSLAQVRESNSSARKADETTQGGESVIAKPKKSEQDQIADLSQKNRHIQKRTAPQGAVPKQADQTLTKFSPAHRPHAPSHRHSCTETLLQMRACSTAQRSRGISRVR